MNIDVTPQKPAQSADPDHPAAESALADRELLRDRRKRTVSIVALVIVVAAALAACEVWRRSRHHWQALWYFTFLGARASWSCDATNWRQGGTTEVIMGPHSLLRPVTDPDLSRLSSLHRLEVLDLCNSMEITDAGLVHLRVLKDLKTLDLGGAPWNLGRGPKITDAGLVNLRGLTELRELSLNSTSITDRGLAHFMALVNLESLELMNTQVTDAGLKRLQTLPHLRRLDVTNTKVTQAFVMALTRSHPEIEVVSDFEKIDGPGPGVGEP